MSKLTESFFKRWRELPKVIQDSPPTAGQVHQFFEQSATPDGGLLRPPGMSDETWRRLVAEATSETPAAPDDNPPAPFPLAVTNLEGMSDSDLGALQDKLEDLPGAWTPEQSKLHFDIVCEWNRRERLNPPDV